MRDTIPALAVLADHCGRKLTAKRGPSRSIFHYAGLSLFRPINIASTGLARHKLYLAIFLRASLTAIEFPTQSYRDPDDAKSGKLLAEYP